MDAEKLARATKILDQHWIENGNAMEQAVMVLGDVLTDIEDWEDKALAEAVTAARNRLLSCMTFHDIPSAVLRYGNDGLFKATEQR